MKTLGEMPESMISCNKIKVRKRWLGLKVEGRVMEQDFVHLLAHPLLLLHNAEIGICLDCSQENLNMEGTKLQTAIKDSRTHGIAVLVPPREGEKSPSMPKGLDQTGDQMD